MSIRSSQDERGHKGWKRSSDTVVITESSGFPESACYPVRKDAEKMQTALDMIFELEKSGNLVAGLDHAVAVGEQLIQSVRYFHTVAASHREHALDGGNADHGQG